MAEAKRTDNILNYGDAIERLTDNLVTFVQKTGLLDNIPAVNMVMSMQKSTDAQTKLVAVKTWIVPKLATLEEDLAAAARDYGVTATTEQLDRVCKYLRAMAEIASKA